MIVSADLVRKNIIIKNNQNEYIREKGIDLYGTL
jgi:hypothetical protein